MSSYDNNIRAMRVQLQDSDNLLTSVRKEKNILEERIHQIESENSSYRNEISQLRPKILKLEPMCNMLSEEKNVWNREHNEIQSLRGVNETLIELNKKLIKIPVDVNVEDEMNSSRSNNRTSNQILTQKHASWCALPALKQLSVPLYEHILRLFQDMHGLELEVNECKIAIDKLNSELHRIDNEKVAIINRDNELESKLNTEITQLKNQLKTSDMELLSLRCLRIIIDQIHNVMRGSLKSQSISHMKANQSNISVFNKDTSNYHIVNCNNDYYHNEAEPVELCLDDIVQGGSKWEKHEYDHSMRDNNNSNNINSYQVSQIILLICMYIVLLYLMTCITCRHHQNM
jgi:predicted RNase H-like nuclease (RuvC/YqgF family)